MTNRFPILFSVCLIWLSLHSAAFAQSVAPALHARILQLEDERNLNGDELAKLLKHHSPKVRERAALAIGRIGDKRGTAALVDLLQTEKDERVRAMAAFALGEMEDAAAVPALLAFLEPGKFALEVRARPVEALGKIASVPANIESLGKQTIDQIGQRLAEQLPDPKATLTIEKQLLTSLTITALMRVRSAASVEPLTRQLKSDDADIRAQAANALSRIRQPITSAVPALLEALNDRDYNVRANAARALGVSKDAKAVEPLIKLLGDKNEQVQVSAIRALAAIGERRAVDPLLDVARQSVPKAKHVGDQEFGENLLFEITAALGTFKEQRALPALLELQQAFSPKLVLEIEVAVARLRYDRSAELSSKIVGLWKDKCADWKRSLITVQTINGLLPTDDPSYWENAVGGLRLLLATQPGCDQRIVAESLRAIDKLLFNPAHSSFLGLLQSKDAINPRGIDLRDYLHIFYDQLKSNDVIVRATAATIVGERDQAKEWYFDRLTAALKQSERDTENDAKLALLTALSKYKSEKAIEAIKTALNDSNHLVRRKAVDLLKQMNAGDFSDRIGTVKTGHDKLFYQRVGARMNKKVTAALHTDKGAITMELFPADAPITVESFVSLARKGYFNNLTFHRVVSNFVIQGGDPQGTGEGGPGYQIRCEVNTRAYGRGAVGMALSGKDTGGSQFFITHSPQPHLDGGYTVFGQVTKGMGVVDRIARGDRIKRIEISER